jgi:hypothetical protein
MIPKTWSLDHNMTFTKKPKFLLVQYAPGSAGKFLMSLLLGSNNVAHFDPVVDQDKTIDRCISYILQHFKQPIGDWCKYEPHHNSSWNLHFVSTKHSRGDDLSYRQFMAHAQQEASEYFWEQVANEKIITVAWHKTYIPEYYADSKIITILIDKKAEKWFHRALWLKLYGCKDGKIHLKMNDAEFNPHMQQYFKKFNNPMYSDEPFFSFVKREILKNQFKKEYTDKNNFDNNIFRSFVNLSDLLTVESCVATVNRICRELDFVSVPEEIVRSGHAHWVSCHNFKYSA